jgi:hypothetical protein
MAFGEVDTANLAVRVECFYRLGRGRMQPYYYSIYVGYYYSIYVGFVNKSWFIKFKHSPIFLGLTIANFACSSLNYC